MARLSMSDIWDETAHFLRREKGLLFPIGFATFGIATLLLGLVAPDGPSGQPRPGPWMIWMLPSFLLFMMGYLAISAIALVPNISVREALGVAVARLPSAILLGFVLVGVTLLVLLVTTLFIGVIGGTLGWTMARAAMASLVIALIPLVWASVRLITLWPLLVDRSRGPLETIGKSFALTSGHAGRIGGMLLLAVAVYMLTTGVAQLAGGSFLILLGRVLGSPEIGHVLTAILVAGVAATLATVWTVFVAMLYRRLAGPSNGT